MTTTDWLAIIGAGTGIAGAVLGVVNTVDLLSKNRVKLSVTPKIGWVNSLGTFITSVRRPTPESDPTHGSPPNRLAVEVVNLSSFEVTISTIGFGRIDGPISMTVPLPDLLDGKEWPVRLRSREAATAVVNPPVGPLTGEKASGLAERVVFVETDCGFVRYGTSEAYCWFIDELLATHLRAARARPAHGRISKGKADRTA